MPARCFRPPGRVGSDARWRPAQRLGYLLHVSRHSEHHTDWSAVRKPSAKDKLTNGKADSLQNQEYVLAYEDKDGGWMLVGDLQWDPLQSFEAISHGCSLGYKHWIANLHFLICRLFTCRKLKIMMDDTDFYPDDDKDLSRKHKFKTWRSKIDGTGSGLYGEADCNFI
ncbi:uncharacterized protein [Lolium perenne]|uniref:uncharacterized protein isoform X1 n=1 Tax=Lolium perenne TaxID=4522 RepID=UPI0021F649EE|nr:uncharacterized protein LOC127296392 isoform X1 [Lolium perenne]